MKSKISIILFVFSSLPFSFLCAQSKLREPTITVVETKSIVSENEEEIGGIYSNSYTIQYQYPLDTWYNPESLEHQNFQEIRIELIVTDLVFSEPTLAPANFSLPIIARVIGNYQKTNYNENSNPIPSSFFFDENLIGSDFFDYMSGYETMEFYFRVRAISKSDAVLDSNGIGTENLTDAILIDEFCSLPLSLCPVTERTLTTRLRRLRVSDSPSITSLVLSPNPATAMVQIKNVGLEIQQITLFNSLGKRILVKTTDFNHIDVSQLSSGNYFLLVKTNEGIVKKQLLIYTNE